MVFSFLDALGSRGRSTPDADIVEARFIDLVPCQRVACTVDFASDEPGSAGPTTPTRVLTPIDGGSRVDVTAADVPDAASAAEHAAGMASSLAQLAEHLERPSA